MSLSDWEIRALNLTNLLIVVTVSAGYAARHGDLVHFGQIVHASKLCTSVMKLICLMGLMYLKNLMGAMHLAGKAMETLLCHLFLLPGALIQRDGQSQIVNSRRKMSRKFDRNCCLRP